MFSFFQSIFSSHNSSAKVAGRGIDEDQVIEDLRAAERDLARTRDEMDRREGGSDAYVDGPTGAGDTFHYGDFETDSLLF